VTDGLAVLAGFVQLTLLVGLLLAFVTRPSRRSDRP